jgi:hypothetical protein
VVGGAQNEDSLDVMGFGEILVGPCSSWPAVIVASMGTNDGLNLLGVDFLFGFVEVLFEFRIELIS